jgi:hypothetical protein
MAQRKQTARERHDRVRKVDERLQLEGRRGSANLFVVEKIDLFKNLQPNGKADWLREEVDVPDDQYFVYGDKQDPIWWRGRYLLDGLQPSEYMDGSMYLLNPSVVFEGGEWEA